MPGHRPRLFDSSIKLWLEVQDSGTALDNQPIPVTQVTMNYMLNSVPEVTCALAVGVEPRRRTTSPTHRLVELAEHRIKVRIVLRGRGRMGEDSRGRPKFWPARDIEIWRGVTTGVGHTMTSGKVGFTLNCAHWVLELDSGSLASADISKSSVDNMLASVAPPVASLPGEVSGAISAHTLTGVITQAQANNPLDVWDHAMVPLFRALMRSRDDAEDGQLSPSQNYTDLERKMRDFAANAAISEEAARDYIDGLHLGNTEALRILDSDFNRSGEIIPGKMIFKDYFNAALPLAFKTAIASLMVSNLGSMSALNKVLVAAQEFSFALVTNARSATCIPYTPVFKNEQIWRELKPEDYSNVAGRGFTPGKLAGVGMLSQHPMAFHMEGANVSEAPYGELAGMYLGRAEGKFKLIKAPFWSQIQPPEGYVREQLESPENRAMIDTDDKMAFRHAGCDFAHTYWADEAFKGRTTQIRIPFRLDIGLGCPIKMNGMSLTTNGQVRGDTRSALYGSVAAVRVVISAEPPGATTELVVTHLRSDEEDKYAPDRHPMYQNVWPGSPLVKIREEDMIPNGRNFE